MQAWALFLANETTGQAEGWWFRGPRGVGLKLLCRNPVGAGPDASPAMRRSHASTHNYLCTLLGLSHVMRDGSPGTEHRDFFGANPRRTVEILSMGVGL